MNKFKGLGFWRLAASSWNPEDPEIETNITLAAAPDEEENPLDYIDDYENEGKIFSCS